jgi:hypothetical protein
MVGGFYIFFVKVIVIDSFFMYVKSLYCVEVGPFFMEM